MSVQAWDRPTTSVTKAYWRQSGPGFRVCRHRPPQLAAGSASEQPSDGNCMTSRKATRHRFQRAQRCGSFAHGDISPPRLMQGRFPHRIQPSPRRQATRLRRPRHRFCRRPQRIGRRCRPHIRVIVESDFISAPDIRPIRMLRLQDRCGMVLRLERIPSRRLREWSGAFEFQALTLSPQRLQA